ncbi:terminase [Pseudoglutamicibacter cumminsii]|uniref:Terminase n=1 Tax=Pseudoglutamicibacter cumminsii TaxID=156979 RepID=A0AAP4CAA1_9MICC|nr:P27 family phage terminase small subunit [Pseudoglutamicibacter cumminsii]MDK6275905.1 terminase [Pseudoglutamicibacter cumminsii]MDZ3745335.1 terminase [Pseudoglutamicibacter cumminsii]
MAKDGTNRGGRRAGSGAKPTPAFEKITEGKDARVLHIASLDPPDLEAGGDLEGSVMPEPSAYLAAVQRDGNPLGADVIYRDTWNWLKERGCEKLVAPRLIEAYAQNFARFIQCEEAISDFGLLGKHPTTGAAIASPFVAMSQSFSKQANTLWYEIFDVVKANSLVDYSGPTPADNVMERLLQARS